jgi:hypothetical protein
MNKSLGQMFTNLENQIEQGLKLYNDISNQFEELKEEVKSRKISVVREPVKSNEELVFDLIKDELEDFTNFGNTHNIDNLNIFEAFINNLNSKTLKIFLFLIIMKGVHQLIENTEEDIYREWCIQWDKEKEEYGVFDEDIYIMFPSFFYFSTTENVKKARDILSNFFGVCILDWWYKG